MPARAIKAAPRPGGSPRRAVGVATDHGDISLSRAAVRDTYLLRARARDRMIGPKGPFCQSCGMPLANDPRGGSANADGSRNPDYCSNCFHAGKFVAPDMTLEQMQDRVRARMKEMHLPGFIAGRFVAKIPDLKRWRRA
jgi:putative zinc ribbon protein